MGRHPASDLQCYSEASPIAVIQTFTAELNHNNYKKAYALLAKPLQGQMSYLDFCRGAREIKETRLLQTTLLFQTQKIAKARITIECLEHHLQGNPWQKQKFTGTVVLVQENKKWRFMQAELFTHPKKQIPRPSASE